MRTLLVAAGIHPLASPGLGGGAPRAIPLHGDRIARYGAAAPGRRADLAVWDADSLAVGDPRTLRCLATVSAGRNVHGDLPLPQDHRSVKFLPFR